MGKRITEEALRADIAKVAAEHGVAGRLPSNVYRTHGAYSLQAYLTRWTTWRKACEACGLKVSPKGRRQKIKSVAANSGAGDGEQTDDRPSPETADRAPHSKYSLSPPAPPAPVMAGIRICPDTGHMKPHPPIKIGQRFGYWRVLSPAPVRCSQRCWWCKCLKCPKGNRTVASVLQDNMWRGGSTHCTKHRNERHRMSRDRTYGSWQMMLSRCGYIGNKLSRWYVGVTVCRLWLRGFQYFYADMGRRPKGKTLGRIDQSKGYCKQNCEWQTPAEQARNKRNNVWVRYRGRRMILNDVAALAGVNAQALKRYLATMPVADAIAQARKNKRKGTTR